MPQAGRLRHRITIQEATVTLQAGGAPVRTWSDVATVWAQVRTQSGGEQRNEGGDQVMASLFYAVTIRHKDGLAPTMRVLWGSDPVRVLEVQAIEEPDNRQRILTLQCVEVVET